MAAVTYNGQSGSCSLLCDRGRGKVSFLSGLYHIRQALVEERVPTKAEVSS